MTCTSPGMHRTVAEIESVLRQRICRFCLDRSETGECGREDPFTCALFRLLPRIVDAIRSVDSGDIREYIEGIRRGVCTVCAQDASGFCKERQEVRCALDAYLLLVVEAIEEATGKTFDRGICFQGQPR